MRYSLLYAVLLLVSVQVLNAQELKIKGLIKDQSTGEPLIGATIRIEGTNVGVATNVDGNYTVNRLSPKTYTLIASYLGYTPSKKTVTISKDKEVNFSLEERAMFINEIVVTGTGTEYYLKDSPVQTEVISHKTLSSFAGRSIEEILGGLSPSFDFNQNDMGANMQLNGLGNDYIVILIDGKKIHGDVGGQNDLNLINPANIERIEIVKGASSSLYGSDAIAGVINIITKKSFSDIELENTTRGGSYSDLQQYNGAAFTWGKWSSSTKFNLKHSDGWRNTTQEMYRDRIYENSVTKTANRFTNYQIAQKATYKANDKLTLNTQGSYYKKDMYRPCGNPQYRTYGMFYKTHSYDMDAKYLLTKDNYISFDASYDKNTYSHRYTAKTVEEFIDKDGMIHHPVFYEDDTSLQSSQQRILSNVKGVFNLGESNRLNTGLEYNLDILKSPYRILSNSESAYTMSAYVQYEWTLLNNLNITGGVRLIEHKEFGVRATPKISALYKLGNVNFRASYSNGFKTPTLKELYYRYERTMMSKLRLYLGNTDLKPQTSNYFSTGVEYNSKKITASVTGYYNRVEDMITLVEIEKMPMDKVRDIDKVMQYKNIEDAKIRGIDFILSAHLGKNFAIGGGYSYLHARANKLNEDGIIEHITIDGTSNHRGSLRGTWNYEWKKYKLGIGVFGKAQSKRYYQYYGNTRGYTTWKINTSHKLTQLKNYRLEFNVGGDNIFDFHETKPYGSNYANDTPGRTYYASVTLRFIK